MRLVQQLHPIFTQNLFDERSRELIVPGRNGRVCREDAKATDTVDVEGFYSSLRSSGPSAARANLGQVKKNGPRSCGNPECWCTQPWPGVSFPRDRARPPGTADTVDRLRRENSSSAIFGSVFWEIGVEEIDGDAVSTNSLYVYFQARTTTGRCSISIVIRPSTG